jgi:hypothetical protein
MPWSHREGEIVVTYWDARAEEEKPPLATKFIVSVDGAVAGESPVGDRYDQKIMTISVKPGTRVIVVEGLENENGVWEKRTQDTGYAVVHRLEKKIDIKGGERRHINFVVPDKAGTVKIPF